MSSKALTKEELEAERLEFYKKEFHRTRGEEWANAITHIVGAVFGLVALILMVVFASIKGTVWHVVSCAIYGTTLVLLFNCSALYHALTNFKAKRVFQIFDHCTIYLLIAGSYTPFCLVTLRHHWRGWTIFGIVWGLTIFGILLETCLPKLVNYLSLPIYLIMGWLIMVDIKSILTNLSRTGLVMLVTGGVVYTLGVIFYVMDKVKWMHTIWHLFVLGGAVCQWVCVCFCLIPPLNG